MEQGSSSSSVNASNAVQETNLSLSMNLLNLIPVGSTSAASAVPVESTATTAVTEAPLAFSSTFRRCKPLLNEQRAYVLVCTLRRCAEALYALQWDKADLELNELSHLASPTGDSAQRMAAAFSEALARIVVRPWEGIARALFLSAGDAASVWQATVARQQFLELCPLMRLAATATNSVIVEAMQREKMIHIVDLGGVYVGQWAELLQDLAVRRDGKPYDVRLTVVQAHKDFLSHAGRILTKEADRLNLLFQFHPVESSVEALDLDALDVKSGYALAVVSTVKLHRLLVAGDGKPTPSNVGEKRKGVMTSPLGDAKATKADTLLRGLHKLSPKVVVLTEHEATHAVPQFMVRFFSAIRHYTQLFASMEDASRAAISPLTVEQTNVERYLLREEMKDIIACHGGPRWARHERMERWAARMAAAGFVTSPMSTGTVLRLRKMALKGYWPYHVDERHGWIFLCRNSVAMFSVSVWNKMKLGDGVQGIAL